MSNNSEVLTGPLTSIRVLDLGMLFAGPLVATHLADLGAEVIKIEHPKGDEVRNLGRQSGGGSLWWSVTARNKKLVAADVSRPEGAEVVRRLAATADVFIENFRPGRMVEWGLDYASLAGSNPGLVMLHISGYGQHGPYSKRPGLGTLAEAFSGFSHVTGEPDGPPTLPGFPLADAVAAITGAYAIMAALFARQANGGKGDEIDLSLYEPLMSMTGPMVIDYTQRGTIAARSGNRARWSVPRNTYRTRDDRWIAVSGAANSAALRLFRAIGRDDMADDPRLATNPLRCQRVDECDRAVAAWVAERTQAEVLKRFEECEVIAGPVNDVAQLVEDTHVRFRESIVEVLDPVLGPVAVQNVVPRFTRCPGGIKWLGKHAVGCDTVGLLAEVGYTEEDIRRLEGAGVIRTAPAASGDAPAASRRSAA